MSLLIDALKQAEAARAQAQSAVTPPVAEGIELEPLSGPGNNTLPDPPASAHRPVARPAASASQRSRQTLAPAETVNSDAARALFEVKRPGPNRTPIILASVAALLFLGGAGYVWWAIQPRSSLSAPNLNTVAIQSNTPAAAPGNTLSVSPALPAAFGETSPPKTPDRPATSQAADPLSARPAAARTERRDMVRANTTSGRRASIAPISTDPEPQLRSGANPAAEPRDANGIQAAYTAFLAGDFARARQRYQDVLRQDPRNVDAMNALGLIAWRSGQPDVAERMFRAAVHADPKDITAMSQLALLYAEGDPTAAEGRLRNLIASQPAAGVSYYALGSLMARQERWNEAQQALFQAYTLDSDNPDVLFNLAVSLEHLAQTSAARQFYERALQAAARRPAGFDKSVAQSRIQALTISLGNR